MKIRTHRGAELEVRQRGDSVLLLTAGEIFLMLSGVEAVTLATALIHQAEKIGLPPSESN